MEATRNQTKGGDGTTKLLKYIEHTNGTSIAIWRVPVMYRLLESIPASPRKKADTRQEHPPMSGPEKGRPARTACCRHGGRNYRP